MIQNKCEKSMSNNKKDRIQISSKENRNIYNVVEQLIKSV